MMPKKTNPLPQGGQQLLEDVAVNVKMAEQALGDAKAYIDLMAEAGEDVSQARKDLVTQKVRIDNWKRTLKARGVDVEAVKTEE